MSLSKLNARRGPRSYTAGSHEVSVPVSGGALRSARAKLTRAQWPNDVTVTLSMERRTGDTWTSLGSCRAEGAGSGDLILQSGASGDLQASDVRLTLTADRSMRTVTVLERVS